MRTSTVKATDLLSYQNNYYQRRVLTPARSALAELLLGLAISCCPINSSSFGEDSYDNCYGSNYRIVSCPRGSNFRTRESPTTGPTDNPKPRWVSRGP